MGGLAWMPNKAWRINVDYHSFWLADRRDALYTESGVAFVRDPSAASSHIGIELDLQVLYRAGAHLQFGGGVGRLFPGQYLEETIGAPSVMSSYLFGSFAF